MAELLLELYSEEIPPQLQIGARTQLKEFIESSFKDNEIKYKDEIRIISTPNRIAINVKGLPKEVLFKSKEVKGPSINAPDKALDGFLNSNQIKKNKLYKKKMKRENFIFIRGHKRR